ncbi:MAG: DUF6653 family protein [Pseudomonadota bacterium]
MIRLDKLLERSMLMDDAAWARHASPWSVYTRIPIFPVLLAAIWSHTALGWWALIPIGIVIAWILINPHAFPPPTTTDTWAAKATFGERVWLNRGEIPIPSGHARAAFVLSLVAGVGAPIALVAAYLNALGWTIAGAAICVLGKLWFCDRMVWLYEDMKDASPTYAGWVR